MKKSLILVLIVMITLCTVLVSCKEPEPEGAPSHFIVENFNNIEAVFGKEMLLPSEEQSKNAKNIEIGLEPWGQDKDVFFNKLNNGEYNKEVKAISWDFKVDEDYSINCCIDKNYSTKLEDVFEYKEINGIKVYIDYTYISIYVNYNEDFYHFILKSKDDDLIKVEDSELNNSRFQILFDYFKSLE